MVMTEPRLSGLSLLAAGLLLGALADATLRELPWGLNAAVVALALAAFLILLQDRHDTRAGPARFVYALAIVGIAGGFVWRDATVLKVLDALALAVTFGLLASSRADQETGTTLGGYLVRVAGTAAHTLFGPLLVAVHDLPWGYMAKPPLLWVVGSLARGLVIAVPLTIGFAILLASADPVFAVRVQEWLDIDVLALAGHVAGTVMLGWIAVGLLRAAVIRRRSAQGVPPRPVWLGLGAIEVGLVLGFLDVLFGAFVWIQVRYLFGGSDFVQRVAGLTYSEYARRGFFELVAVSALVLPMLLVAHWLLKQETRQERLAFGLLAGIQVALVLVMLCSALYRMRLYQAEYGLTELRLYSTAFMAWLGVLLALFALTVLRGRRDTFATGALASGLLTLAMLHAVDPESSIVRANLQVSRGFDAGYALGMGADAVPVLVDAVSSLEGEAQRQIANQLLERWLAADQGDWRRWSVARARARRSVARAEPSLRAFAGGCPWPWQSHDVR
jgi:Domain of unknown function (DUF4173)